MNVKKTHIGCGDAHMKSQLLGKWRLGGSNFEATPGKKLGKTYLRK
jgi:hypothetical protein